MSYLKRYRLPSFTITVRECTPAERATIEQSRDAVTVVIKPRGGRPWVNAVGSPIYGDWCEDRAARAAISFASCDYLGTLGTDEDPDTVWAKEYGETLTNEAYCHRVLGKELRQ